MQRNESVTRICRELTELKISSRYRGESVYDLLEPDGAEASDSARVERRRPSPQTASPADHLAREARYRSLSFATPTRRGASVPRNNLVRRLHRHTKAWQRCSKSGKVKYVISVP